MSSEDNNYGHDARYFAFGEQMEGVEETKASSGQIQSSDSVGFCRKYDEEHNKKSSSNTNQNAYGSMYLLPHEAAEYKRRPKHHHDMEKEEWWKTQWKSETIGWAPEENASMRANQNIGWTHEQWSREQVSAGSGQQGSSSQQGLSSRDGSSSRQGPSRRTDSSTSSHNHRR